MASEKRWLIMKKIAFYILERPVVMNKDGSEFKDDDESDGLAPIEVSAWHRAMDFHTHINEFAPAMHT